MNRNTEEENQATAIGRQALREITGALALSVALLALMVATVLIAGRDAAAMVGVLALALAVGAAVVVMRRANRAARARDEAIEQERRGREQLDRTLAATRRLVETESPAELRRRICEVAREVFDCAAVSLWEVENEHLRLLDRAPWAPPYVEGDRRPIAELPGLREALDSAQPLFVADLQATASGQTQATAEVLRTGSLLNVPVSFGGVSRLDLILMWNEVLPPPSPTQRIAVQRFGDQAGLALEQSRHRVAQAEIASLNRTLSRLVQTDPLFKAGGTVGEVSEAICTEALGVFEATGAALWLAAEEGIELVRRVPDSPVFAPRILIPFSEHPSFAEDLTAGQPRFVADVEHDDPVLWERYARHSGSRSQLRLPLASGGDARALIVLSWGESVEPPSAQVSAIASRFADQAGVALAEAARREATREAGELHARFEESLLPTIELASPGVSVATFYRPGDARLSLGGDFYDCLELADGSIALLIGDVAGHGPAAAALGAGLRSAWRALVLGGWELEDLPGGLQAVCVRERHDPYMFVTAIAAHVGPDRGALRFVSAGHPAPMVVGASAGDGHNGPPLGIVGDAVWAPATISLPARTTVLLYTDGLVEGRAEPGSAERLGVGPIEEQLASAAPGGLDEDGLRRLVELATRANGAGLPDDVALLALNLDRDGG